MAATGTEQQQSYTFKASRWSSHSQLLSHFPPDGRGKLVLDVGCWDGQFAALLAQRGYSVTGIERQRWAEGQFPASVQLIEADLHQGLPALPGQFDFIVCADILEHLLDPAAILRGLAAHLKENGKLISSLPNSGNIYFRLVVLSGRFPKDEKGLFDRTHLHFYTGHGWQTLFKSCGYTMESAPGTPMPFTVVWGNRVMASTLERVYGWLVRLWPSLFAYQFIVSARREPHV